MCELTHLSLFSGIGGLDLVRVEYRKNPTIENANKLVAIIEGRSAHETKI